MPEALAGQVEEGQRPLSALEGGAASRSRRALQSHFLARIPGGPVILDCFFLVPTNQ